MKTAGEDRPLHIQMRHVRFWRIFTGTLTWGVLSLILLSYHHMYSESASRHGGLEERLGLVLLVLFAIAFLGIITRYVSHSTYQHVGRLALLGFMLCLTAFSFFYFLQFRSPIYTLSMFFLPASTMVVAVLLSPQLAFTAAVIIGILISIALHGSTVFAGGLITLLPGTASSFAALVCADHIWPPSRLARASTSLGLTNLGIAFAVGLFLHQPYGRLVSDAGISFVYGICSPLLALGSIFLLQRPFDITSHIRLLEISNPKEPLLHRLQTEAPGTYYSSVIVANLAEAAAEAIGADPLFARVGALYHDIGKLNHPDLFVENQFLLGTGDAHAKLSPTLSTLVILAHVRDGLELARRYGLPRAIRDIIAEHHGTTMVSYFYHQAKMRQPDAPPPEGKFRYEGCKPRSKESAIVMLSDVLQAAAKAMPEPSIEWLESLVEDIITERLKDGQLQESDLTFRELSQIKQSFLRSLQGLHLHTRVAYPATIGIESEDESPDNELSKEEDPPEIHQPRRRNRHATGRLPSERAR